MFSRWLNARIFSEKSIWLNVASTKANISRYDPEYVFLRPNKKVMPQVFKIYRKEASNNPESHALQLNRTFNLQINRQENGSLKWLKRNYLLWDETIIS